MRRRPAVFERPLTPLEVGGLLAGLAMVIACCCGCLVWSTLVPADPPRVPGAVTEGR